MRRNRLALVIALLGLGPAGCELTEVTLVDFSEILVAEVYVSIAEDPADNHLRAFLHGTEPGAAPSSARFDGATVTVTDEGGTSHVLGLSVVDECVSFRPEGSTGSCFSADLVVRSGLEAGQRLALEIDLPDGRGLRGVTRVPGAFEVEGVSPTCRLAPDTRLPLRWSRADSAWAYVSETSITGLPEALAAEGIEAPDTLHLVGLSISETDTTVVFPNEFGVFDRFDLDADLSVRLQEGIPEGATADVAITAVDRNYVNWVRGGSFNPSGAVRVSSLTGDGSGVFGSAVTRRFTIVATTDPAAGPSCAGASQPSSDAASSGTT